MTSFSKPILAGAATLLALASCSQHRTRAGDAGGGGQGGGTGGQAGDDGAAGTGGQPDVGHPDNGCVEDFNLMRLPPDVLIVFDRSGSMNEVLPSGSSKWVSATAAIDTVLSGSGADIKWGLWFFPNELACGVATSPAVDVGLDTAPDISKKFGMTAPGGATPTSVAIQNASQYLGTLTDANPRFLLLVTDGVPNCGTCKCPMGTVAMGMNCCQSPPPCSGCSSCMTCTDDDDADGAVAAVAAAAVAGTHTFVVGIALDQGASATLDAMADAGLEPRAGAPTKFYPVGSEDDLDMALNDIANRARGCAFPLSKVPDKPDGVRIFVDGSQAPRDMNHVDGWDFGTDLKSIVFYGSWCDRLRSQAVKEVKAYFGCGTI